MSSTDRSAGSLARPGDQKKHPLGGWLGTQLKLASDRLLKNTLPQVASGNSQGSRFVKGETVSVSGVRILGQPDVCSARTGSGARPTGDHHRVVSGCQESPLRLGFMPSKDRATVSIANSNHLDRPLLTPTRWLLLAFAPLLVLHESPAM